MLDKEKNEGEYYPYLRNLNVQWLKFDLSDIKEMRFQDDELKKYNVKKGDILVCEGGEPGRAAIWRGGVKNIKFQKALHRVRTYTGVEPKYFVHQLLRTSLTGELDKYFTGSTIDHFTGQSLSTFAFPLPPPGEQRRLVETVDRLMSFCDDLAESLSDSNERGEQLLEAALRDASTDRQNDVPTGVTA
jgi:type I restriction enzyme S subunit